MISLHASKALSGTVAVPGDKSISHRALFVGLVSDGVTEIRGLLESEDVLATKRAVVSLGAKVAETIDSAGRSVVRLTGAGIGSLLEPVAPLDFGNAGTGVRLAMGLVGGHAIQADFVGDESLSRRPMDRILEPLCKMGATVLRAAPGDRLPVRLKGTANPLPMLHRLAVPSAQVKSAILLCGLNSRGTTTVEEPLLARDHTEIMLRDSGADLATDPLGASGRIHTLQGRPTLLASRIDVPGDPSSAAFLFGAAIMVPGSEVTVRSVLMNPLRSGFIDAIQRMGADVKIRSVRSLGSEPTADVTVRYRPLQGISLPPEIAPRMIDEYPILSVIAATAAGETYLTGLQELTVKESNRLTAIAQGLAAQGVNVKADESSLRIRGVASHRVPPAIAGGGPVSTHHDHRIAMSFYLLGLACRSAPVVDSHLSIATSFPQFFDTCASLGVSIHTEEECPSHQTADSREVSH